MDKPYTNLNAYYGTFMGPLKTMNVYNNRGVAIARARNEDTAALIAAALNAYSIVEKS